MTDREELEALVETWRKDAVYIEGDMYIDEPGYVNGLKKCADELEEVLDE